MLFLRESYAMNAYEGQVSSFDDWLAITDGDYETPQQRTVKCKGNKIEAYVPLLPARAKTREGYIHEMVEIGFAIDTIQEVEASNKIIYSASIYVYKP